MKLLVVALFAVWPGISSIGDWLLSWTIVGDGDSVQVVLYETLLLIARRFT